MTKQEEALTSLASGGITERAEAVRELGRLGDVTVLDVLLTSALGDKSPGVRLAAASATADVLARYRLPEHRAGLKSARRREIITGLRSIDPGRNTGIFQVLACAGDPAVVRNIGCGVRDPRVDVRTGALVGLERLASSGICNGVPKIAKTIGELLRERRLRSDASLELARLARRAGLWSLRPDVEALAGRVEERWLAGLDEVLDNFPERLGSEHLLGCWVGNGLDCGEQRERHAALCWLVVLPSSLLTGTGLPLTHAPWTMEKGVLDCEPLGGSKPVRVVRGWYDGKDDREVLQVGSTSFGRLGEEELPALVDLLSEQPDDPALVGRQLLALMDPQLSDEASGAYVRAVLCHMAADPRAQERLEVIAGAKPHPAEVHWHLARLHRAAGRRAKAKAAARRYLRASSRESPFREQAELWVGGA